MSDPNQYPLSIAGIPFLLETDHPFEPEEPFLSFQGGGEKPRYIARFRRVAALPPVPEKILCEDICSRVHPDGKGGYIRSFFDPPRDYTPYAVGTYDYPGGQITIDYLEKGAHCVSQMSNSFFHIGFEALLIQEKRLCLHAACVSTYLGGLLFSGPSGIGKSTQAALWQRYRNARLMNGDRPILSRESGGWAAWGSPYAGSSRCYVNERVPVTALLMLRQAEDCGLRRLEAREAFRQVYSGLTMYSWDAAFVGTACDLAMDFIERVPVFEFRCTPDRAAVEFLEAGLREELRL